MEIVMAINVEILLSRIEKLCAEKHISQNMAFVESGVGKNFKSNLKSSRPSVGKITMLANYFGVSVDYLMGNTDIQNHQKSVTIITPINEKESRVLFAYRSQPEMQLAVDRLLGIADDGNVTLYSAAKSTNNHAPSITTMPHDKWSEIENAPNTDDDLL